MKKFIYLLFVFFIISCSKDESIIEIVNEKEYEPIQKPNINPNVFVIDNDDPNVLVENYLVDTGDYSVSFLIDSKIVANKMKPS